MDRLDFKLAHRAEAFCTILRKTAGNQFDLYLCKAPTAANFSVHKQLALHRLNNDSRAPQLGEVPAMVHTPKRLPISF